MNNKNLKEENLTEEILKKSTMKQGREKIVENACKGEIIMMVLDSHLVKEGSRTTAKCYSGGQ